MKAIRIHEFGGPEVLKLEEIPDPKPGANQVVVRVRAIGVNPVDGYIRSGSYGQRPLPYTPGMDSAGTIESVGTGVTRVKPGDRVYVYATGAYAEKIVAELSQVFPLPEKVTFQQGAAIGVPYGTAYYALFHRGHAMAGEWLLINGASGGVGIAAVQIARSRGLKIIGTAGTDKGRDLVLKEGAHHALDHHAPDLIDQILKLTGGQGVNILLEMLANVNLGNDLKCLATHGRVVVIGSRGKVEIDPRDGMSRNADIRTMSLMFAAPDEIVNLHSALIAGLENGSLRPIISEEFPLAEAAQAQVSIMESGSYGKIVLIPA